MHLLNLLKSLIQVVLPEYCILCKQPSQRNLSLCLACENDLPWLGQVCIQCAQPLASYELDIKRCGKCLIHPPYFDHTIALFNYQPPITSLITQLKFYEKLIFAKLFGVLLAKKMRQYYQKNLPEYIIPVPLHKKRLKERGFNQALEIARMAAKQFNIPIDWRSFVRTLNTPPQTGMSAQERKHNVKNAFNKTKLFQAKHIVIIDDVMTTGNTLNEFAKIIKRSGVERVDVWCCARTLFD